MIKSSFIFLFFLIFPSQFAMSQETSSDDSRVYRIKHIYEVPLSIGGFVFNAYGQNALREKPRLTENDFNDLVPEDVNWFDRSAAQQDPEYAAKAHVLSNHGMNVSIALPFLLLLDKKVSKYWIDFLVLYVESHAVNATVYLAVSLPVRRKRPFVYNPDEFLYRKEGPKSTDSFFSGHVSTTATSTFFMAKVYADYHPDMKHKWLLYAGASLAPIYTGYFRYKAAKHFLSDIITGFAVGAAIGILTPQFHHIQDGSLSLIPIGNSNMVGLRAIWRL